jgi:hypothetical protein
MTPEQTAPTEYSYKGFTIELCALPTGAPNLWWPYIEGQGKRFQGSRKKGAQKALAYAVEVIDGWAA